jgi:Domain of unknown function (DUF1918)
MTIAPTAPSRELVGEEVQIATPGHSSTSPDRRGTITAVVGEPGREHYLVRWPDGRESVLHQAAVGRASAGGVAVEAHSDAEEDEKDRSRPRE